MKLPKLKYYYLAMTSDAYIDFATRRVVEVDAAYRIDLLTGSITGTTRLVLCAGAEQADTEFRRSHNNYTQPVYVLRIPYTLIDRKYLTVIAPNQFGYTRTLNIDHCGVERIEYDHSSRVDSAKVIDTAELKHI
jgi:hypothetical protein